MTSFKHLDDFFSELKKTPSVSKINNIQSKVDKLPLNIKDYLNRIYGNMNSLDIYLKEIVNVSETELLINEFQLNKYQNFLIILSETIPDCNKEVLKLLKDFKKIYKLNIDELVEKI